MKPIANTASRVILTPLLWCWISCFGVQAQMYTFSVATGTYTDLSGATSLNNGQIWDDPAYTIDLGFEFQFFNQTFDTLYIHDAFAAFDTSFDYVIAVIDAQFNFDLVDRGMEDSIASRSPISYQVSGNPGSRIVKVEWGNVGFWYDMDSTGTFADSISYQLWLYEGINVVEVRFGPNSVMPYSYNAVTGPDIGLLNSMDGEYMMLNGNPASPGITLSALDVLNGTPSSGEIYRFAFGGHCTNGVVDGDETGVDCGGSGCPACHCSNGVVDGDETGIDCGGADCGPCWPDDFCPYDNALAAVWTAPVIVGDSLYDTCIFSGQMITVQNMIAGNTYRVSTCYNNYFDDDLQLSVYPSWDSTTSVVANDDYCDALAQIFFTPDTSGDYDILLDEWLSDSLSPDTNYYPCMHLDECRTLVVELMDTAGGQCGPKIPEICMVTYDRATGKNVVVWEETDSVVQTYHIYRETNVQNKFDLIGSVPVDSLSLFTDLTSNPMSRQYRYKISASDGCGMESEKSAFHKTMHLSKNVGIGGEINLIWSEYVGYSYSSVIVMRYSATDTVVLDTLPGSLNFYTDLTPPPGNLTYQIEIIHPAGGCTANKSKNFNSSKSNTSSYSTPEALAVNMSTTDATLGNCDGLATASVSGGTPPYTYVWNDPLMQNTETAAGLCPGPYAVTVIDNSGDTIVTPVVIAEAIGISGLITDEAPKVYPNPNNGRFTIEYSGFSKGEDVLLLFDALGRVVHRELVFSELTSLDIRQFGSGIYNLKLISGNGLVSRTIVVE